MLVLANSSKLQHRCIAGIDMTTGEWIRPVSNRGQGELYDSEACVILTNGNRRTAAVGDVVDVELGESPGTLWHPEDRFLIGPMRLKSTLSQQHLVEVLVSRVFPSVSILGDFQDRIALEEARSRSDLRSLQLVRVPELKCYWWSATGSDRPQLRGQFQVAGKVLSLSITDTAFIATNRGVSRPFVINLPLLTISLASPFRPTHGDKDYCYKLIAAVISGSLGE